MDDEIVGYRIAIMNWNNGYLNAMDVVVKKRGHNGMNMMMDFIEKQNYPRWICGVREDNVISQRKILQWKSKEGKGYEYTPWNDGTYRSGSQTSCDGPRDFLKEMFDKIRRGARVVECTGLENQDAIVSRVRIPPFPPVVHKPLLNIRRKVMNVTELIKDSTMRDQ